MTTQTRGRRRSKAKNKRHIHHFRGTSTPGLQKCEDPRCGQLKGFDYKTQTYTLIPKK